VRGIMGGKRLFAGRRRRSLVGKKAVERRGDGQGTVLLPGATRGDLCGEGPAGWCGPLTAPAGKTRGFQSRLVQARHNPRQGTGVAAAGTFSTFRSPQNIELDCSSPARGHRRSIAGSFKMMVRGRKDRRGMNVGWGGRRAKSGEGKGKRCSRKFPANPAWGPGADKSSRLGISATAFGRAKAGQCWCQGAGIGGFGGVGGIRVRAAFWAGFQVAGDGGNSAKKSQPWDMFFSPKREKTLREPTMGEKPPGRVLRGQKNLGRWGFGGTPISHRPLGAGAGTDGRAGFRRALLEQPPLENSCGGGGLAGPFGLGCHGPRWESWGSKKRPALGRLFLVPALDSAQKSQSGGKCRIFSGKGEAAINAQPAPTMYGSPNFGHLPSKKACAPGEGIYRGTGVLFGFTGNARCMCGAAPVENFGQNELLLGRATEYWAEQRGPDSGKKKRASCVPATRQKTVTQASSDAIL